MSAPDIKARLDQYVDDVLALPYDRQLADLTIAELSIEMGKHLRDVELGIAPALTSSTEPKPLASPSLARSAGRTGSLPGPFTAASTRTARRAFPCPPAGTAGMTATRAHGSGPAMPGMSPASSTCWPGPPRRSTASWPPRSARPRPTSPRGKPMDVDTGEFAALTEQVGELERQVRKLREDAACRDVLIRAGMSIEREAQVSPAVSLIEAGRSIERQRARRRSEHLRLVGDGGAS